MEQTSGLSRFSILQRVDARKPGARQHLPGASQRLPSDPNEKRFDESLSVSGELLAALDGGGLTSRYWLCFFLFSIGFALDLFDFYIVGFLLAVVGPDWHLTYMESSIVLLSAGIGAIIGGLAFGMVADAHGRKRAVVVSTVMCAVSAFAISLIPDRAWLWLAILRFLVGCGIGGVAGVQVALLVELTPTRYRTALSGLPVVAASFGVFFASLTAATFHHLLGWRGIAMLGAAPALIGFFIALFVPESPRWLVSKGRLADARSAVATMLGVRVENVPIQAMQLAQDASPASLADAYRNTRRFWATVIIWSMFSTVNYGVYLWGPTIVAMTLRVSPREAATYFVAVAAAGILGRIAFAILPAWTGRRRLGAICGYGGCLCLAGAALLGQHLMAGLPVFAIFLALGAVFFDGVFCVLSPYTAEVFPVRLAARGLGIGQAANGLGKIAGPLCLALIAGANNFVTPQATEAAVLPAFLFLAGCALSGALCFSFIAPEVSRAPLTLDDRPGHERMA